MNKHPTPEAIRAFRHSRGLTLREFAAIVQSSPHAAKSWELGYRKMPGAKWELACHKLAAADIAQAAADHRERVIERGRGPSPEELEQINAAIVAADMVTANNTPESAP